MVGVWNLFSIGRHRRNEDQLTEMLVWLVDAVPDVGRAILRLAFNDLKLDGDVQVTTQHGVAKGRLDALFVGPNFALVVESKIDSGFGADQITRYLDWLAEAHEHRENRALMTLTAHPDSWSAADIELARRFHITRSEHRWEELHEVLGSLVEASGRDELSSRLISEFLEMLGEEGLIPMKPLEPDEFTQWRGAYVTVRRFHDFFLDCREAIAEALGATTGSKSTTEGYIWQDYVYEDGSKIVVGLGCTDEDRVSRASARYTPVLWLAVEASHWPDWTLAKDRLESAPPAGWSLWSRWWGERPQIHCYLEDVLGNGTFEEQRQRLAEACGVGRTWLRTAQVSEIAETGGVAGGA